MTSFHETVELYSELSLALAFAFQLLQGLWLFFLLLTRQN